MTELEHCAAECPNTGLYFINGKWYCFPHWLAVKPHSINERKDK